MVLCLKTRESRSLPGQPRASRSPLHALIFKKRSHKTPPSRGVLCVWWRGSASCLHLLRAPTPSFPRASAGKAWMAGPSPAGTKRGPPHPASCPHLLQAPTPSFPRVSAARHGRPARTKPDEAGPVHPASCPHLLRAPTPSFPRASAGKAWMAGPRPARTEPGRSILRHARTCCGHWQGVDDRPMAAQDEAGPVHPASCPHVLRHDAQKLTSIWPLKA